MMKEWNGLGYLSENVENNKILLKNFYDMEIWGCWMKGSLISEISFKVSENILKKKNLLKLVLKLRKPKSLKNTSCFISLNNDEWIKLDNALIKEFLIPYNDIIQNKGVINIKFKHKNVKSPKELGISNDSRILGMGLENITYFEVSNNENLENIDFKNDNIYNFLRMNAKNINLIMKLEKKLENSIRETKINYLKTLIFVKAIQKKDFDEVRKLLKSLQEISDKDYEEVVKDVDKIIYPSSILSSHNYAVSLKNVNKEEYLSNLDYLVELLSDVLNKKIYLVSGTLLGFIRDKDFIAHDDDIDLAVLLDSSSCEDAAKEFLEIKNLLISKNIGIGTRDIHIKLSRNYIPLGIDLFPSWIDKDNNLYIYPHTFKEAKKNDLLPLKYIEIGQYKFPIPNNSEKILEINYGRNWKNPDPFFKFDWKRSEKRFKCFIDIIKESRIK